MNSLSFFYTHPIFRYEEFSAWKKENGVKTKNAVRKALYYHTRRKHILNILRGIYGVIPPSGSENLFFDPYLIAAKGAEESILAYHTTLELHGVAYSIFEKFTFITPHKNKPFEFQGQWFQPVAIPKSLKNTKMEPFAIEKMNRQGINVSITNLARTFVDVLDRPGLSGGWEEVVRSINNIAYLNVDEVIEYCLLLKNRVLAAKVGFFLEQRKGAFAIEAKKLERLLFLKPSSARYIEENKTDCRFVKKWNLFIPVKILDKIWEEPNNDI